MSALSQYRTWATLRLRSTSGTSTSAGHTLFRGAHWGGYLNIDLKLRHCLTPFDLQTNLIWIDSDMLANGGKNIFAKYGDKVRLAARAPFVH
jgi:hypothetical protein